MAQKITIKTDSASLYDMRQLGNKLLDIERNWCGLTTLQKNYDRYKKLFPDEETAKKYWQMDMQNLRTKCEEITRDANACLLSLGLPTIEIDFENTLTSL